MTLFGGEVKTVHLFSAKGPVGFYKSKEEGTEAKGVVTFFNNIDGGGGGGDVGGFLHAPVCRNLLQYPPMKIFVGPSPLLCTVGLRNIFLVTSP